ncbi:MAG: MaoC family dehydratase [Rhodospirillales bacterium]|nr:MaoC family dehydratase [Rhodospirillales bacterium]
MDDIRGRRNDLDGYSIEDLSVGMTARYAKTITEADLVLFAGISGDCNPVHMNENYALSTPFKGRIVHGMLSASFLSTAIATKLPGPGSIYVSQNLKFRAPVRIGDTVEARVTIVEIVPAKNRVVLKTTCTVGETVVIDGDATVMVPTRQ